MIKIKGLLLQGSGFDESSGKLVNPPNNMPEFLSLPTCYICWISMGSVEPFPENELCNFPVFISSTRERTLCQLKLPNIGQMEDRIIAGVAILLSTDEWFEILYKFVILSNKN